MLLQLAVLVACQSAGPSEKLRTDNFQEILEHAQEKVFPALVFVKPIVEDFESGERTKQQVFGSGVIISPEGLVVTNNHVVEKAIRVHCVLSDKDQVSARILGKDSDTDLALLQLEGIDGKLPLPYGEFADSNLAREGDFVMALGSPFGFTRSISLGILSNTQRYLGFDSSQYRYNTWLQTDAAINPGNSGGPLVNIEGKIVGINTLSLYMGDNIGFTIPSNVVKSVAERLRDKGSVERAWTGLRLQALRDFYTDTFTPASRGVLISHVEEGSPAQEAGVRGGDILVGIGEKPVMGLYVEDLPGIEWTLADLPADTSTALELMRGEELIVANMTPALKGKVEGDDFDCRRWNMTVKEINKHKEPGLFFYQKEGVYVLGVRSPGNAVTSGVGQGDILVSVDGRPVNTLEDIRAIYESVMADEGREKKLLMEMKRKREAKWVVLDYTKDYDKPN
jgi:serine protease Do